jgi:hypothetical protein
VDVNRCCAPKLPNVLRCEWNEILQHLQMSGVPDFSSISGCSSSHSGIQDTAENISPRPVPLNLVSGCLGFGGRRGTYKNIAQLPVSQSMIEGGVIQHVQYHGL